MLKLLLFLTANVEVIFCAEMVSADFWAVMPRCFATRWGWQRTVPVHTSQPDLT